MMTQKRILLIALVLIGIPSVLFAQTYPLPQIPQRQPRQNLPVQNQAEPAATAPSLTLTRRTPEELEQALRQICGSRFSTEAQFQYTFTASRSNVRQQCSLRVDPQSKRAALVGDKQLCDQVFQLITAIDQPPPQGKERTIVPIQHTPLDVLSKALEACRTPAPQPRNETAINPMNPLQRNIRQVNYQFQEGGMFEGGVDPGIPVQGNMMPGFPQFGNPAIIGMPEDLRILYLPLIDTVVLEADGARLARLLKMIEDIEQLSIMNRPKIEVIYLKHINNVSFGALLPQFYAEIFATVPGAARLIPLTTPNAILLVGWGDAMETAREILTALDQPMATEHSRMHLFKLKHISVTQARATLAGAFPVLGNAGFASRIQLFSDQRTNLLIVQAAPNELEQAKQIINEIDVATSATKMQVAHIKLKHTLASDLATTVRNVIASGNAGGISSVLELLIQSEEGQKLIESGIMSNVTVEPDTRNNVLIITAPEGSIPFLRELITLMDMSSPEAEIKIFQLINSDAASIRDMLTSLIPTNIAGTPGPQLPGATNEETLIQMQITIDARTNCIVVAGSPGDLKIIEALLFELDREDQLARKMQVYFLKNMKAEPVAATIQAFVDTRLQIQQAASGVISNRQQLESALIIVPDAESNSLIIGASERYFDEIMDLIKELDKSPPQVVIKVLVAEVTLSDDKEWTAELGLQDPLMFSQRGGSLLFSNAPLGDGTGVPGTVGSQLVSTFGPTAITGGGMAVHATSDYLNILLRALHDKKRLEVLSSPQVMTMNNTRAIISVGQSVPRYRGGTMNQQGVTDARIDEEEVALELQITPTISPEGNVVMVVGIRKEKLGQEVTVGSMRTQTIDKALVTTMVSAANNQTVVLGGLITKEENKIRRKVPLLGDVPLLGKMFRQELDQTTRKELLVILTPHIVLTPEEAEQVKQMEMARMSWCLNNVSQVYGDVGAYNVISERPYTGNVPVIMPGAVKPESLRPMDSQFIAPVLPKRN